MSSRKALTTLRYLLMSSLEALTTRRYLLTSSHKALMTRLYLLMSSREAFMTCRYLLMSSHEGLMSCHTKPRQCWHLFDNYIGFNIFNFTDLNDGLYIGIIFKIVYDKIYIVSYRYIISCNVTYIKIANGKKRDFIVGCPS